MRMGDNRRVGVSTGEHITRAVQEVLEIAATSVGLHLMERAADDDESGDDAEAEPDRRIAP
jgi:hypothetical protein